MRIDVLTLFPEMFTTVLNTSIIGNAVEDNIVELNYHNIRDNANNKHNRVDDYPYGGGLGMLMQCEPIVATYEKVAEDIGEKPYVIMMSPYGKVFDQEKAKSLAKHKNIVLICGHYEGIDYRVNETIVDEEISIGNFILTGGELPAMMIIDAIVRTLPGTLKEDDAHEIESYSNGLLEFPQYTRPSIWREKEVPEVLIGGHHANILKWQHEASLKMTYEKRPELLEKAELSEADKLFLEKLEKEKLEK